MSEEGSSYDWAHKAFLQAFLSKSVMTVDEIKPILAAVMSARDPNRPTLEGDVTAPLISSTIQAINERLTSVDYEIRSTKDQTNKHTVYALVNTTSDSLTQLATTFTPDAIAYIKRVLDCMFETNNTRNREVMAVTSIQASQLAKAPTRSRQSQVGGDEDSSIQAEAAVKSLTIAESEKVLADLFDQDFIYKSRANYYSLAPRALMELRTYLKETYNEPAGDDEDEPAIVRIRDCDICREIVTVGVRCSNRECNVRFHDSCATQYFRSQRGNQRTCPKCKGEWLGDLFVGERAANKGQRRTTGGRSSNVRSEEEEEEDEDE
ncbi:hypothetical protein K491DRAFT_717114 [Lophiostoma macrostomum CBS 122681]|uniref:Non-structural maintenance of chromosomes element 1 homolog n=1 Tax=Lophiostoma macrostomum CBS 122681 TaxID=1314788 RepID=A0A6A6T3N4_9PLEO|nr:hypothetical protein K491DRAFT_717114 [Lophiostoma macrostomum CBS 122681]